METDSRRPQHRRVAATPGEPGPRMAKLSSQRGADAAAGANQPDALLVQFHSTSSVVSR